MTAVPRRPPPPRTGGPGEQPAEGSQPTAAFAPPHPRRISVFELGRVLGPAHSGGPSVLDWHSGLGLASALPEYAVFSPPDAAPTLPYASGSIDVVVLASADPAGLAEARRVARQAVFTRSPTGLPELRPAWSGDVRTRPANGSAARVGLPRGIRRVLLCAPRLPELDRQSGSRRMFDFVQLLVGNGVEVAFLADNVAGQDRYAGLLRRMGVSVHGDVTGGAPHLIESGRFDLAVIAFWHLAERLLPLLRAKSPGTGVVVDSVDLEFVRRAGQAALDPGRDDSRIRAGERARELAAYAAADGVLAVSEAEAAILRAELPPASTVPVHVVPDGADIPIGPLPFAQRRGIVFVANFWHPPNADALDHLADEIVPALDPALLARHPLAVVGNGVDERVARAVARIPHARLVGWVPSVVPYLHRARVSVLPLRYGAGTKRKLIEALLAGTATVATSVGAEGLPVHDDAQLLIADDPTAFAAAMTRLLAEPDLWRRLSAEGRRAMAARHDGDAAAKAFAAALREIAGRSASAAVTREHPRARESRVLVIGVVLAGQPNNGRAVIAELASSRQHTVEQRWAAIGRPGPDLAAALTLTVPEPTPKIPLLRRLLDGVRIADYDFIVLCDDDVALPPGFLDRFLDLQRTAGFALAQPARTEDSYIDHPIVQRQPGVLARRTLFVESGPVVCAHRSAFPHLLPFPEESPMGWGIEEVWSHRLDAAGLTLGIIDAVPVGHRLRPPTAHYRREDAEQGRAALLAAHAHRPMDQCLRVLDVLSPEH
ncbi:MAG TPA: glycosyltransferase family 4 protein [Actinospica sp.]|nr:glycosyltransferase family 4 protein [Actinospica sp.]